MMKRLSILPVALLLFLALAATATQAATVAITLKDADTQAPIQGVKVELYLSYGILAAQSDAAGTVVFEDVRGRGFWLVLDGVKRSEFYRVADSPFVVLVSRGGGAR